MGATFPIYHTPIPSIRPDGSLQNYLNDLLIVVASVMVASTPVVFLMSGVDPDSHPTRLAIGPSVIRNRG